VAGAVVAPAVAAQLLMDKMQMDGFYRKVDAQAQQAASSFGTSSAHTSNGVTASDVMEVGVEIVDVGVEAASGGVDLLDVGVDFVLDIVSGIGSAF
jgi:hypothetical protein